MSQTSHRFRAERGFSMFLVVMAMLVTSMFVAAAFAAANSDLVLSGKTKDRKSAYAAAEAGLNFYLTHLNQDSDYWTKCENPPKATPTELAPVNQPWDGTGPDPRIWRTIPGSTAQYTLELLPAKGTKCDPLDATSMIDLSTGTFRVRATGAVSKKAADAGDRRSIVANFRRAGFLDFLYFTYYEDQDPQSLDTDAARDDAELKCARRYRKSRTGCKEIQFVTGDVVSGPLHSNDSLLICNRPIFGRDNNNKADRIEVTQPVDPLVAASGCTQNADMQGVFKNPVNAINPPASNGALRIIAQNGGYLFTGKTFIRLKGDKMDVTTTAPDGTRTFTSDMPWPGNGVVYVQNSDDSCTQQYPNSIDYTDDDTPCANVYVSGSYSESLTIAAYNDVVVAPTDGKTLQFGSSTYPFSLTYPTGSNAVLGLIANNFVRVGHPISNAGGCHNAVSTYDDAGITIKAAILSIDHSFIVDNFDCGHKLGNLNVFGAIAQRYRGPVGTTGGTGFLKAYKYDDRLKYRSPPHFLSPIDSAWAIVRSNEQIPSN